MATSPITGASERVGNSILSSIPVIGGFLGTIAGSIESIFGANHAQAVAKENSTLNNAVPAFYKNIVAVVQAATQDLISTSQAIAAVQQLQADYYAAVRSINNASSPCTHPNGWASGTHGSVSGGHCNASCFIGCNYIENDAHNVIELLGSTGGSVMIGNLQQSSQGITGIPPITISYTPPSVLLKIERSIQGFFSNL